MATFPALAPSTRAYTPGGPPSTAFTAMSGEQSRVRHSTAILGSRLELTYERLSETDRQAIELHYHGQQGEFRPFTLSPETWSGFVPLTVDPYGWWRYAEPPEVEDFCGPTATVRVILESVVAGVAGAQLGPITVGMVGGEAYRILPGAALTVTVSFTAGAATASNPAGPLLLLHMEGTGTTVVDSSASPRVITLGTGNTQDITQSTTQKKFGDKSLYFPSGWSWLDARTFAVPGGFSAPVGAVTFEMFFWFSSQVATEVFTDVLKSDSNFLQALYVSTEQPGIPGVGLFIGTNNPGPTPPIGTLATETWHYLKITRDTNGVVRRFVNGTEYYTGATHYDYSLLTWIHLGSEYTYDEPVSMKGYIDEVRLRPEVDNSLTVPTAPFPDP